MAVWYLFESLKQSSVRPLVYLEKEKLLPSFKTRMLHLWFLLSRPMTLGVRVVVQDDEDRVLLVRHTYVDGWHLPGGGVDRGETAVQAVIRELEEETFIRPLEAPQLLTVLANKRASKRDHVLLFRCGKWESTGAFVANREIAEIGFFPLHDLPTMTTGPTRQRLVEVIRGESFSETW